MRRLLAVAVVAAVLMPFASSDALADPAPADVVGVACDVQGPMTIDQTPSGYMWRFDGVGKCRGTGTYTINLHLTTDPTATLGLCAGAGISPAPGTTRFYYFYYGTPTLPTPSLVNDATGSVEYFYYFAADMLGVADPAPPSGSAGVYSISAQTGHPRYPEGTVSYEGAGVEGNRIFLKCPTALPSSSNARFIFTLDRVAVE